ncbi:MAG TPA: tripartite tricarboxylate transporter substrate binding protein [Candidatus Sulfotelmatobacter sp.]|nr:tripartite tricarboxylate transporter substrate binding protein [Candidatus Sulfotelmatobacter sp.]
MPRWRGRAALAALLLWAGTLAAAAQDYPNRPIRFIVPWPPGGGADIVSRIVGQRVGELLGQQLAVDNRPGAGGNIGTEVAARATPDGYTIVFGYIGTHAINPGLYKSMPFQPKDLAPVTLMTTVTNVLVVHPSVPARSVTELIALARAHPGQLNFSSAGNGSLPHLAGELFKTMTHVDMVHVPFKGGGPAVAALIGGEVQLSFADPLAAIPAIKAGQLVALGVTATKRTPGLPDVPTIAEAGVPGFEATGWNGILVPAGTPAPVVATLHDAFVAALETPNVRDRLVAQAYEPVGSTPEEFARVIATETEKWGKVIKLSGARVD